MATATAKFCVRAREMAGLRSRRVLGFFGQVRRIADPDFSGLGHFGRDMKMKFVFFIIIFKMIYKSYL